MLFPSYNQCCRGGKIATGIDTLSEGHWGLSNTAETFIMWKSVKGNNQKEGKGKLVTFRAPSLVKLPRVYGITNITFCCELYQQSYTSFLEAIT